MTCFMYTNRYVAWEHRQILLELLAKKEAMFNCYMYKVSRNEIENEKA